MWYTDNKSIKYVPVAQWIERYPAEVEVRGSSPLWDAWQPQVTRAWGFSFVVQPARRRRQKRVLMVQHPSTEPLAAASQTSRLIRRTPFFYGWVVMMAGTFGLVMTSPGQTYGISIFIEPFIADLGLSRSEVSSFYTIGTLVGSLALPYVGRQVDRHNPQWTVAVISVLFGVSCLYMSLVQNGWMLLIGFVLVRMLGQGSLGLVSTYVINQWWMRRRGTINGISGVAMALLGVGAYPNLVNWLIPLVGWRATYAGLGAVLLLVMAPVGALLFRARPEVYGLQPDGAALRSSRTGREEPVEENWTAPEATRTAAFWTIVLGLGSIAMLSTGLTFHMVSIFADNALPATIAAAVFVPIAATTAVMNLVSGVLVDRIPVRVVLVIALLLQALALWMAQMLDNTVWAIVYGMVLGALMGLMRTVSTVALASYFGRLHLGSISGVASTTLTAASALGPLPMGLARDLLGSYNATLSVLSLIPLLLAVVALGMRKPVRRRAA